MVQRTSETESRNERSKKTYPVSDFADDFDPEQSQSDERGKLRERSTIYLAQWFETESCNCHGLL